MCDAAAAQWQTGVTGGGGRIRVGLESRVGFIYAERLGMCVVDRWVEPFQQQANRWGALAQASRTTPGPVASGPCSRPCHRLGGLPEARTALCCGPALCYVPARARLLVVRASFESDYSSRAAG